ncbi:MAG: bifunctional DNA-formamidopyrimidine glycosylase/DNA-(apurinic or apyrimidinic site) lyase [Bryobacteraceae bacterium]
MPELPEVETVVRTLAPALIGRRIESARFTSRFVTPGNRDKLAGLVSSRTVRAIRRHGKFILIELASDAGTSGTLSIHLGMTGKLLVNGTIGVHTHGVFQLDRGELHYEDIRQFGRIEWDPARVGKLGPDALGLGLEVFCGLLRKRKSQIKPLLLNQTFVAGLGNIYVDEALFRAGIHPLAIASRVRAPRAAGLHEAIQDLLRLAIAHGGSSISDYVDAEGRKGGFQNLHQVYGREGQPCVQCGSPIRRIVVGQRGTHFCAKCQRR